MVSRIFSGFRLRVHDGVSLPSSHSWIDRLTRLRPK
jgi:hypothetical protein